MKRIRVLASFLLLLLSAAAHAQPLSYQIDELYSQADGSVQFVILRATAGVAVPQALAGRQLTVTGRHATRTVMFPSNLPADATVNARVLVATAGFQAIGLFAPDYVIPD